ERGALRMFTSCAWFFDDIGGIEPRQVLRYARRAIELAGETGTTLEAPFLDELATAQSNDPNVGTGRDVYLARAVPRVSPFASVAAGAAAVRAMVPNADRAPHACCQLELDGETITLTHCRTGRRTPFTVAIVERTAHDIAVSVAAEGQS